ncbi:sirohydrochlorin chelatase [Microbacterium sp. RD1]|uniref:sirohydrochlorin chelatase n=1 Tax=Microbacterium sp. RD1 TaxID=3457313 RepID=UPI003FA54DDF
MPTLIACSHGTNSLPGRAAIATIVEQARMLLPDTRVVEAFVDVQEPRVDEVVAREAPGSGAVVVPLLLSTGFHTNVDIARAVAAHPGALATAALGPHELLVDVLATRVGEAGLGSGDAVVLAAAGSSDPAAAHDVARTAEMLAVRIGRPVSVGFAAGNGQRIGAAVAEARAHGAGRVVAASYVLAHGFFADVIASAGADAVSAPLAPDPRIADVVAARYRAAVVRNSSRMRVGPANRARSADAAAESEEFGSSAPAQARVC